jgi:ATP-binding cassette subfamily B protein
LVLIYYFSISDGGLVKSLPILGLFILAAQRMNPQLQNIYSSIVGIKETQYPLYDVLNVLELNDVRSKEKKSIKNKINVNSNIVIKQFSFFYENAQKYIFKDCEIKLEKNKIYGLYGNSGSGKSTFLDILMGLLKLNKGSIYIDNKKVDIFNNFAWQKNICYVSQGSILNDTSIIENIAYGHNIDDIDWEKAKNSAILAEMTNWIDSTKDGFNTVIGEKGTKISGGQRQRLFLARAFYSNKQIMLLDEFTNALDLKTEEKILKNLKKKSNNKIILIISHTKKINGFFDHIYKINNQKIELIK